MRAVIAKAVKVHEVPCGAGYLDGLGDHISQLNQRFWGSRAHTKTRPRPLFFPFTPVQPCVPKFCLIPSLPPSTIISDLLFVNIGDEYAKT